MLNHFCFLLFCFLLSLKSFSAPHVQLTSDNLFVDGEKQPFLFGAEVQYFRARGGSGRNVPKRVVEALWNKMLDRVKEAGMNSVVFYIPWDFHEPVEGVFDFDGTLDRDHDGKPDYPSRNLKKFFELVEAHGIKNIMVRPGPYINAEWGPEGFGAVPKWFLDNYPQALTKTLHPGKPRTVSFSDPNFRLRTEKWFKTLYQEVLKDHIGPKKSVVFLQIDNETNYFWDAVYERDISIRSLARYRDFLKLKYRGNLSQLNEAYGANVKDFSQILPPKDRDDKTYSKGTWHYDWFYFHDAEILDYYQFLRNVWERLGVKEPDVLFTSCDSFNAPKDGLLPRLDFRNNHQLTFSTLNIYPKTFGTNKSSTLNNPMKAAHDASLMSSSHEQYYGNGADWLMSTETMGGWFPPTEVSLASRSHTYGSLLASGVKAMIIYYFHEGWNWTGTEGEDTELRFDAPLDKDMNPRPAFTLLKGLGESLNKDLGPQLMKSRFEDSEVLIAHDSNAQYLFSKLDAIEKASTESSSLFGLLRESGHLPKVAFIDAMSPKDLLKYKVIFWDHPGYFVGSTRLKLEYFLSKGGTLVTIGQTGLISKDPSKLIVWTKNPSEGWNTDQYLSLKTANASIAQVKEVMKLAGVKSKVEFETETPEPFLHVWTRPTENGAFLIVENFGRKKRNFRVRLPEFAFSKTNTLKLLWNGLDNLENAKEFGGQEIAQGVSLSIESDSISIWSVLKK